jgi:hypothetical protein
LVGIWQAVRRSPNRELGRVTAITLLILIVATLSIHGYSIYRLFLFVPGVSSVRAVSRVVLVMLLPLGILVAIAMEYAISLRSNWIVKAISIFIFLLLLVVETVYYRPYSTHISKWHARQAQLKAEMPASFDKSDILFVTGKPGDYQDGVIELDAMILAQDLGLATLNGYSGNFPEGHVDPYPCVSYKDRIASFFALNKNTELDADELDRRVKQISLFKCPVEPTRISDFLIDQMVASHISLKVIEKLQSPRLDSTQTQNLTVTVSISNNSDKVFSTVSTRGPVRLSWRFVPLNLNGEVISLPEWTARKNLYFSLKKDEADVETLQIPLPKMRGKYLLEISLVQDGVAWFHDLGMPISQQIIEVP